MQDGKSRNHLIIPGLLALGGLALVGLSLVGGAGLAWLSNVLIEAGVTLFLFAPLLLIGMHVERRIEKVQESQANIEESQHQIEIRQNNTVTEIAALAEEVAQTQAGFRDVQAQLRESVLARMAETRAVDETLFESVSENPTPEGLGNALNRASELGLIHSSGCRVEVPNTHLYVKFPNHVDMEHDFYLPVRLELMDGSFVGEVEWTEGMSVPDFLHKLGEEVTIRGHFPGDKLFDPVAPLTGLGELLRVVHRRHTGADGVAAPLGAVIQFCAPQWVITNNTIGCVDPGREYIFGLNKIGNLNAFERMLQQEWVDEDSFSWAYDNAKALHEGKVIGPQPNPWALDEPPF